MKSLRWAILGTGFAARKFVQGLHATSSSAVAVASRSKINAQSFASEFGINIALDDYQQIASLEDVDAVYIATPPSLHRDHALIAISSGKPVLIEKPFAMNVEDAREIVSAARKNNVFCMEAMWTRFLPAIKQVKQMVDSGVIGDVHSMSGMFSIVDTVDSENNLFNSELGGGALLHRGVYPLSLVVHFLGVPDQVLGDMIIGDTGVDEETSMLLHYKSRRTLANIHASTRSTGVNDCLILGSKGRIHIQGPVYRPYRIQTSYYSPRKKGKENNSFLLKLKENSLIQSIYQRFNHFLLPIVRYNSNSVLLPYAGNGYHYQVEEVHKAILEGKTESSIMPLSESIAIVEIMDDVRNQVKK